MTKTIHHKAVIDVETGGFSITKNGLCEIALLIVNDQLKIVDRYQSLIRPYKRWESDDLVSYKPDAMAVNGIDLNELEQAPKAENVSFEVYEKLIKYNVDTIIAHNAHTMDQPWVEYFLERFGHSFKFDQTICTLKLARESFLPIDNHKLQTLRDYFNIESNQKSHRALADCKSTLKLLKCLNQI